ncbi:pre-mRNA 3'-end-processing factor FIP1 isoform X2 [Archocentrus centrarchus]|uniref:pre-mRNA 3'-end-processing factor FIP1 isoform X2 n=1 Tax=Archocentrus centrarchus TaxID=63155 RepID=UPI0011EA1967|nr:pre-mRNA 3'-end-processing factor FIP1 isoform X2 [Archocentrus centrarchus]
MAITSIPRATVTVRVYGMDTTDDKEETQRVEIPSSSGHTSEHLRRTRHAGGTTEDPELENIQGNEKMNQNVELLEKKPWRKAGANISDYFNYGFDEKSWNAYRRKQAELHGLKRKENAKNRGQKRQTGYREEGTSCAYSSPGTPSILAFRESDPTADLIGGQPESSRQHWHQYLNDGVSNIQVFCEDYNEDNINADQLPPPVNMNSLFEFIPPSFLFHPGPQPPFPTATLVSGNSKGFDNPATSLYPCPSRRITISPGVIDATKAWECYILQEKRNEDRDRSREHGHDRNSKRSGYKEKESCFSSRCSKEEQRKHRDARKRGYEHRRFERGSREKRRRDKDEGSRKTSESSVSCSRRSRDVGGNKENRRKHKKAKRSRKDKENSRMVSADRERKLKFD